MATWVIIGAGYTGTRLAQRLVQVGESVIVTRRSIEAARAVAAAAGPDCKPMRVDFDDLESLDGVIPDGAIVVDSVPPRSDTRAEELLVRTCGAAKVRRLVYVGSTGVYPAAAGQIVTEETPVGPIAARGQARLAAEKAVLDQARNRGVSAVSLRVAGIYGPGRGVHARLAAGTYRIIGAGESLVCRVHVDDLVSAIMAAGTAEPLPFDVVNVADDEPTGSRLLADEVAAMLGVAPPPSVDPQEVSANVRAMLGADRRIANDRLKGLGVQLRYPSWRQGILAAIAESS